MKITNNYNYLPIHTTMKFISTKTHGIIDYLMGLLLIVCPWLFGFARGGSETWILVILGLGIFAYSALTDYEYGAIKQISMRTHLWLDGMGGLLLAASPWLFGFAEYVFWPHLIFGLLEIGAALTTHTSPITDSDSDMHLAENRNNRSFGDNAYSRNRTTVQTQAGTTASTTSRTQQAQPTAKPNTQQTQSKVNSTSPQSKSNQDFNSSIKSGGQASNTSTNQTNKGNSDAQSQRRPLQSQSNKTLNSDARNKPNTADNSSSQYKERDGNQNRSHSHQSNEKQTFVQNEKRNEGNPNKKEDTQNPNINRNQANPNNPKSKDSPVRDSGQQQVNAKSPKRDNDSSDDKQSKI